MGKKIVPHDPSLPFKEKEKGGEGRSKAWWLMEGEGKVSFAWRPMEGKGEVSFAWRPMECSIAWWPMECEGKTLFIFFHLPPNKLT
jgi:hypothetical protein